MFNPARYSRSYRFRMICNGVEVSYVRSIEGLGNDTNVYDVPFPAGRVEPYVIGSRSGQVRLVDMLVKNKDWFSWIKTSLRGLSDAEGVKRDLEVEDLDTGMSWRILSAVPVSVTVSGYDKAQDDIAVLAVVLQGTIIECGEETETEEAPIEALLKDSAGTTITLRIPGPMEYGYEADYSESKTPGIEGDNSEWIGSRGATITLPFHIVGTSKRTAKQDMDALIAIVKKDPDSVSPKIISFTYGDISLAAAIVISVSFEEIHRDGVGNILIAKGMLSIRERWQDTEHTKPELKGLGIYETVGGAETYHSIAYALWQDETLWLALRAWNPRPEEDGPCLPGGTVLAIPPYEFVSRYKNNDGGIAWLR